MSESLLIALGDLTNGAINYYQNPRVVMTKRKVIETYIDQLQQEKQKLKQALLDIKEIFDEYTFTNELGYKNLIITTQKGRELSDIVNKALGSDSNG